VTKAFKEMSFIEIRLKPKVSFLLNLQLKLEAIEEFGDQTVVILTFQTSWGIG
jgi:hypothetical protein